MSRSVTPQSASLVDPGSIRSRVALNPDAELLIRCRPPGGVDLAHGQREHMLLSSIGHPVEGEDVRSVLRTSQGRQEWRTCPTGHVTFVPAGYPMEWDWSYRSESLHLTLAPSFLSGIGEAFEAEKDQQAPLKPMFRVFDQELTNLLHQLHTESAHNELGRDLVTSSLILLIATRIYRKSSKVSPAQEHLDVASRSFSHKDQLRSIELINDRLDESISLAELAGEFKLSPYHFSRVFKRATGFPPHEYQLQQRISRARELLTQQFEKTIAEIANELGFSDESHFRRHFKRIVGTTPGRFRKQQ